MKKLNSGFTLIELMIVVAIIGILAAVAIPQYQNYVARAQVSEALSLASGAKVAVAEYFNTNGTFPADNSTAGLTEPTDFKGNWVESVTVSVVGGNALITALFSSTDAHSKMQGGEVTLTAVDHGGSIGFACSSSGTTDISAYLPSSCIDLTGTPIVGSPSTPTTSVPADGTLWGDLTPDEKASATACWDGNISDGINKTGWVVGQIGCNLSTASCTDSHDETISWGVSKGAMAMANTGFLCRLDKTKKVDGIWVPHPDWYNSDGSFKTGEGGEQGTVVRLGAFGGVGFRCL